MISDDTVVFVLLLHVYSVHDWACTILMEGANADHTVVDITATTMKHQAIIPRMLATHALSGCDIVAR